MAANLDVMYDYLCCDSYPPLERSVAIQKPLNGRESPIPIMVGLTRAMSDPPVQLRTVAP